MAIEGTWNPLALRLWRTKARLSVHEMVAKLAEDGLAIDPSTANRWEAHPDSSSARTPRDPEVVRGLARVLGCSIMVFYRPIVLTYDDD